MQNVQQLLRLPCNRVGMEMEMELELEQLLRQLIFVYLIRLKLLQGSVHDVGSCSALMCPLARPR